MAAIIRNGILLSLVVFSCRAVAEPAADTGAAIPVAPPASVRITATPRVAEVQYVEDSEINLPWHTTDLYWTLSSKSNDVQSIAVTFTIDRDVPESCNLYIAPLGGQNLNQIMFYGGIQTNINGWASPAEQRRVHAGRGAIFSRWGGEPVDIEAARPEKGGLCESAGYEGHFASVRMPYKWGAGVYTWEIRKLERELVKEKPHTWFGCFLKDHQKEQEFSVGALRFEGETFSFDGRTTSFVEIYGTERQARSMVPEVTVQFKPPVINGVASGVRYVTVYHPRKGSRGSPSPALARATVQDGGIQVALWNRIRTGDDLPAERYKLLTE